MSLTQDLRWSLGRSVTLQLQRQTDLLLCTINCFLQWDHLPNMAVGDLAFYYTLYLCDDLMGKLGALLFKRFNTAPLHSFQLMGPKFNWEILDFKQAEKEYLHRALILHCSSYISKIVWWLPIFDFGIFCHLHTLMGIYRVGPPTGYLKCFVLSFISYLSSPPFFLFYSSFFPFFFCILHFSLFSFLFFIFFLSFFLFFYCLSLGGLFNSGAPVHCPPMPPSRYATACVWKNIAPRIPHP